MAEDGTTRIAVAVVEQTGCYLIGLRPEGVPLAGYWEFPGGKLRAGESAADAAVRECLEETGLRVVVTGELECVRHEYAHGRLELRFFACRLEEGERDKELDERFRWVGMEELRGYRFPPANEGVIGRIVESS